MARYSASQIRNMIRQAEQKRRRAIDTYNQGVRRYNQNLRTAVNQYNSAVSSHNSRVRSYRQRIVSELNQLNRQSSTQLIVYRTSVQNLYSSYERLESRADSPSYQARFGRILDLSEREAANSLIVANHLLGDQSDAHSGVVGEADPQLLQRLQTMSSDLIDRWRGAVFALNPRNPDAARHFCTSAREILTRVIDTRAPDAEVLESLPNCDLSDRGRPTRRAKLKFILSHGNINADELEDFTERDVDNLLELFRVFNDGTHGSSGRFDLPQLAAIKKRVEDGIYYLTEIVQVD